MPKSKSVLVTGGAGFIGSHVVDRLIDRNFRVIVIDNLSSGYQDNVNPKASFYKTDIISYKELDYIFKKENPLYVVHAAANIKVRDSVKNPVSDAKVNIIGGLNVIECCRKYKVKKIIYLCTGGALYGNPKYTPVDEEHQIKPLSPYGVSKYSLELYLSSYLANFNLDYISLRFSNVYGPRDGVESNHVIPAFITNILKNKSPIINGDGNQGRDFIYVIDVVDAVLLSLTCGTKERVFNIGTGKLISINKMFQEIRKMTGVDILPVYVAKRKGDVKSIYLSAKRAKDQLGWRPKTNLKKGLKETIKWFKEK